MSSKRSIRTITAAAFLQRWSQPEARLTVRACRRHLKRGRWRSRHEDLDEHLLLLVERGSLRLDHEGRALRVEGGDLVWVPPGAARTLRSTANPTTVRHHNVRFVCEDAAGRLPRCDAAARLYRETWVCLPLFELLQTGRERPTRFGARREQALLTALLTQLLDRQPDPAVRQALDHRQRRRLQQRLAADVDKQLGPADLAATLGLNLDHFTRLFTATYGQPPRRYLRDYRIRLAAERLVASDLSVQDLASELGYTTASFFCRQFRQVLGCSPGAWRRRADTEEAET